MQSLEEFQFDVVRYKLDCGFGASLRHLERNYMHCNGCGSKGGVIFPSTMYGVNIEAACNIHDIDWHNSKNYNDLVKANHRFRINIESIIDKESANRFMIYLRSKRMFKYYNAVKLIGLDSYAESRGFNKNEK